MNDDRVFLAAAKMLFQELRNNLAELSSLCPHTRAFLATHGKEHVNELSIDELKELTEFLRQKYKSLLH